MKRIVTALLAAFIILLGAQTVIAEYEEFSRGLDWEYDSSSGTLTITGNGKSLTEAEYKEYLYPLGAARYLARGPWQEYAGKIRTLKLTKGVEYFDTFFIDGLASLRSIETEEGCAYRAADGVLFSGDMKELIRAPKIFSPESYKAPEGVEKIREKAFENCNLKSVSLPSTLKELGKEAFSGCASLIKVESKATLEVIPEACFAGTKISDPGSAASGIKRIENGAFRDCVFSGELIIPDGVEYIGKGAFSGLFNVDAVKLGEGVKVVDDGNFSEGRPSAILSSPILIYRNDSVRAVILPKTLESIGENCFSGFCAVKELELPDGLKSIGSGSFSLWESLEELILPESLECFDGRSFSGCDSLRSVTVKNPFCGYTQYTLTYLDDGKPEVQKLFSEDVVIYGYTGSIFEDYADKNGNSFISIGNIDSISETGSSGTDAKVIAGAAAAMIILIALSAALGFIKAKDVKKSFVLFWALAVIGTVALCWYPLSMGVRVLSDMIANGTVRSEDYPKYVIPYTPISLAVIAGVILLPAAQRYLKRFALPVSGALGIGIFLGAERLLESRVTVTATEITGTLTKRLVEAKLSDWQTWSCIALNPIRSYEESAYTTKAEKATDIIMGNYSPAFRLHFYLISVVLILGFLACVYGFGKVIRSGDRSSVPRLTALSVCTGAFLGMCVWACFTAFYRTGELTISPLSAALMCVFFVLLGATVGIMTAYLLRKRKSRAAQIIVPAIIAAAVTALMYVGEMALLNYHLYRFGDGFFFDGLGALILAPVDIAVILLSGAVTLGICAITDRKRKRSAGSENESK